VTSQHFEEESRGRDALHQGHLKIVLVRMGTGQNSSTEATILYAVLPVVPRNAVGLPFSLVVLAEAVSPRSVTAEDRVLLQVVPCQNRWWTKWH
jgi:hypothetical protein